MPAILIVDDDKNQRLLLEEEFQREGYDVLSATSGPDALATVERAMPDVVVLDLAMPGMDGLELLGRLLGMNNRLPVIIHTAHADLKDSFMSWAADAYVIKHSDLSELKDIVRRVVGGRDHRTGHHLEGFGRA